MVVYVLKRFIWMLFTLLIIVTLTFFLMHAIPGNPISNEQSMTPAIYQNMLHYYHLDRPLIVQYLDYLKSLMHGQLGPSIEYQNRSVNQIIGQGFPVSAQIGLWAISIAFVLGVLFGVIGAVKQNGWQDYSAMILAILGISIPNFVLATLLINYLGVVWGILPSAGWGTPQQEIMPILALAVTPMAYFARLMRTSMLEVLQQDYVRTARAKGLNFSYTILKHTIRNAILPVLTMLGPLAAYILTGSFVIEKIFGIPGMGQLYVTAIDNRDYPLILGTTIFFSAVLIFILFLVDTAYAYVDPRIQLTGRRS
ncbi:ABC transporter permease [Alicyclobacillus sp. SO9]|uniref:ABC transporter permease n=1 Tax=Alicyclobacillus sp. SO9 TaxID=2665646 RepID=UPI0018E755DE|nr:ABC transporter permease [Alicyclobacillus sp. SO9]QQE80171.1 ABC transporter permease [Alicyclobacillus sp. SO9]